MILSILRYIPRAIIDLCADILAFILAPIAALFVKDGEIHPLWKWITTHDAPIGSGHIDGYWPKPKLLWWSYVKWIWRNPAYQVGHWLGYDQTGMVTTRRLYGTDTTHGLYKDPRWGTGVPNRSFWRVVNKGGQTGFLAQGQIYYYKNWCIEYQFGWKLYRRDPDKRCMLAFRISPFKRY